MPLQATSGAASYDAFGGGLPFTPTYIEDVFNTYLWTGNGSSQTITNNIDLSGKGGMVWIKSRSNARNNILFDTNRGATQRLFSNLTSAQSQDTQSLTAFNANGFSVGSDSDANASTWTYAGWSFREQAKFFDVVTYTGNGANRTIAHTLGAVPGCIIVKRTDTTGAWAVYHRSLANTEYLVLNTTAAKATGTTYWNSTTATSTDFSLGTTTDVNANGGTYVAYLFAHDAGGFGLTGTDNVISCGSYTGNGNTTGPVVTLGYEPQWLMVKRTDVATNWVIFDVMRGMSVTASMLLYPNLADDEGIGTQSWISPTATGFQPAITNGTVNANGGTYIYIAIRRGPMKTPTSGTSVYGAQTWTGGSTTFNTFPPDLATRFTRTTGYGGWKLWGSRLQGLAYLNSINTSAEAPDNVFTWDAANNGTTVTFGATDSLVNYYMSRAPGFFDVVCYTGTGSATTFSHNLGVVPELMIVKSRSNGTSGYNWTVYSAALGATKGLYLNTTGSVNTETYYWNDTAPTASVFSLGNGTFTNASGATYVNYLFATVAGVSKVGSYTGTGTTLQVNCGFTSGARFVMIKRTDSTGDWYVWDSTRGIVAGNDPYLLVNSGAAEVTNTDYVDTYNAGFEISSTAPAAINANGGTFIFLAIA